MDLRDRLKAMGVRPRTPGAAPAPPATNGNGKDGLAHGITREPSAPLPATSRKKVTIDQALSGAWHETDDGPCFAAERRYPVSHVRGPVALGSMLQVPPLVLWDAGRAPQLRDLDARRLLFLDTETTGLSGGTGTYVFLVGVAFFSADGTEVVVRQYFMSDIAA